MEQTDDGATACTFAVPASFPGFQGHFPGEAVLPGMCHVDLAVHAVSAGTGRPQRLVEIVRARFRRKVGPGQELRIVVREAEGEAPGSGTWRTEHRVGDALVAVLHLRLADE